MVSVPCFACMHPANICAPACLLRCRGTETDTIPTADITLLIRTANETKRHQHRAAAFPSACGRGRSGDAAALVPCDRGRCDVGVIDSCAAPSHPRICEPYVLCALQAILLKKKKRKKNSVLFLQIFLFVLPVV